MRNNHIIASGYNGPASGVQHCDYRNDEGRYSLNYYSDICPRQRMGFKSGEGMDHCPAVHAEINTILQAAKFGVATDSATLYCYCNIPCTDCTKEIINSGIQRVVCLGLKESRSASITSSEMFNMANVVVNVIPEEDIDES